ncbi:odorant receptor 4-like [Rhodnius prolixus]
MKIIKMKCDSLRDEKYEWNLEEIINNHRMLLRYINYQKESIGLQLCMQNVLSTMNNCLVMYLINNTYDTDKILFTFCCLFLIFVAVLLGAICDQGESVQSESEKMFQSIYNTPWYKQSPKNRKSINLMLLQASRPLVYDYKRQSPINRLAFRMIINGSYSYFMLLKSFE